MVGTITVLSHIVLFAMPGLYNTVEEIFHEPDSYSTPDELKFTGIRPFVFILLHFVKDELQLKF